MTPGVRLKCFVVSEFQITLDVNANADVFFEFIMVSFDDSTELFWFFEIESHAFFKSADISFELNFLILTKHDLSLCGLWLCIVF